MADLPSSPDSNSDTPGDSGVESDRGKTTGLARWQKVVGIIGLIVVLLVVIGLVIGGGHTSPIEHGMGLP